MMQDKEKNKRILKSCDLMHGLRVSKQEPAARKDK